MVELKAEAPMKILIDEIRKFKKKGTNWVYCVNERSIAINVNKIIIQGEISKTAGLNKEIFIINDGSGEAKVIRGALVPGDLSWINAGVQCSIVGTLSEDGKLPVITAEKIAKITNHILFDMWPWEVKEVKNVITENTFLELQGGTDSLSNQFF